MIGFFELSASIFDECIVGSQKCEEDVCTSKYCWLEAFSSIFCCPNSIVSFVTKSFERTNLRMTRIFVLIEERIVFVVIQILFVQNRLQEDANCESRIKNRHDFLCDNSKKFKLHLKYRESVAKTNF